MEINKDLKKVAVLYAQNDAFNKSETETFQQAVKDLKLDLATVQTFQTTDTDFTAQVTERAQRQARPRDHLRACRWTARIS